MKHFDWKLIYFFIRHHHRARIYCEPLVTWPRSPWLSSTTTLNGKEVDEEEEEEEEAVQWMDDPAALVNIVVDNRADNFKIESVPETTQTETLLLFGREVSNQKPIKFV